jgi:ABC-2 type transport system ATP-binding protein
MAGLPAIRVRGLSKRYGATLALDGLDLTIEQGEVYAFLGSKGAGKTTTIRLLLGLHRPSSGRAQILGFDTWKEPVQAHGHVGHAGGEPDLWPSLTGAETFEFLARLHGGADAEYRELLIERFRLDADKKVRALSKEDRRKIQLIAALASRADVLLLDDPTSGSDPLVKMALFESIKEAKARRQTVFLCSQTVSDAEAVCDRVGILRGGRLVDEGTLDELRYLTAQAVEVTFDGDIPEIEPIPGVKVHRAGPNSLRFVVTGSIAPLIEALGGLPVLALTSQVPSLEEISLRRYDHADMRVAR